MNVSVAIENSYPLSLDMAPLSLAVLMPGCNTADRLVVATATTSYIKVTPKTSIGIDICGVIRKLPAGLTAACPSTHTSPMENFLDNYLHGSQSTIYVTGEGSRVSEIPGWLLGVLGSVTVPVSFPGNELDSVIRSFSLSHVAIELPGESAKPDSPDSMPRLTASIEALIALPEELKIPIDIHQLRVAAEISHERPFAMLHMVDWMPTESLIANNGTTLLVKAKVYRAPLNVTDYGEFGRVIRKMLFQNGNALTLGIAGATDADISTGLGRFIVRNIPASGNVTIDVLPDFAGLPFPRVNGVIVENTTSESAKLRVNITVDNPTAWEAKTPYANFYLAHSGLVLGNISIRDMHITPGSNHVLAIVNWNPLCAGADGIRIGSQLIGQYISGELSSNDLVNFGLTLNMP